MAADVTSRGRTIELALVKLGWPGAEVLRMHLVGADHEECGGDAGGRLGAIFGETWARLTAQFPGLQRIEVLVTGPNLFVDLASREVETGGAVYSFRPGLYHDVVSADEAAGAHLAVCFNAGVWGYDTWAPTLLMMASAMPVLVTSYSIEEAEDDEDCINEIFNKTDGLGVRWHWESERNEARAAGPRTTLSTDHCADAERAENLAWLCFEAEAAS
mmetsp:Transcript_46906/g.146329  ORF Transcript_46906/g.146329 Transcript_46906/m.146329 type:complete len:216 (-) Transcript_46906:593-1240(-)